ncbi:Ig-like domain-containing protein [Winogradskyella thalassocola]|uniref:Delta-60 repeat domain-containing protein/Por secretion system C-terminal sorting domain-containing protein n=1 Tax=Winogradskyella thalassocola TaxID=262004 RepID=A0A1G8BWU4_9FLAO|nr:LamG-like jellyroll fold domain-containing protein [Winogradskyella thalassocola]SDH37608.1 delta-60 repeat domain-containing protein/Por secretion system C-terminal sorting domain-containing protein [Winogradskyella thalassocola]
MKLKLYLIIATLFSVYVLKAQTPAPTAPSIQIYADDAATLADLTVTGSNIQWYNYSGPLPTTTLLENNTFYYVSQTIDNIESTNTAIRVYKIGEANQTFCGDATVANIATNTIHNVLDLKLYTTASEGTPLEATNALTTGTYYVDVKPNGTRTSIYGNSYNKSGLSVRPNGKIIFTSRDEIFEINQDGTGLDEIIQYFISYYDPYMAIYTSAHDHVIVDTNNNRIKEGFSTLGSGFNKPRGIAETSSGRLVIADTGNNAIKIMDANGNNLTTLGNGFNQPYAVAIRSDGKILVADTNNNAIKLMDADGSNIITLGSGFNKPRAIAIQADGKIVIADSNNSAIKRMNADGSNIETLALSSYDYYNILGITTASDGAIFFTKGNTIYKLNEEPRSNRVAVNVVVDNVIVPTASTQVEYLLGDTASALTASTGGTGLLWYESETGGTGSTIAPTPDTATTGSTSYWVSSMNNNSCESDRVEIVVLVAAPATHLNFDGSDYVTLPNEADFDFLNNQMTIEFWMNSNVVPEQWDGLVTKGDDSWRIHLNSSGTINCAFTGTTGLLNSTTVVTDGNWHHVSVTLGNDIADLYIDGVLDATMSITGTLNNSSHPVAIGENLQAVGRYFSGDIDDVRIWNVARTAEQINNSLNCELQGTETGLMAYYTFNQGNGGIDNTTELTVIDATENAYNGTFNDFALTGAKSNFLTGSPVVSGVTIPSAPIASSQLFCDTVTVAELFPEASVTIHWYDVATEGTPLEVTQELTTGTYYVAESNANGCESERTEVSVTINPFPLAPAANSLQIYTGEATIADLIVTGTDLLWYDAASNGTSLDLTDTLVDGAMYYVSQTDTCGESLRTSITVKEISEASQTFCGSATVDNLTSSPSADATVSWYSEATGGTALDNTTALATGTYYIEESVASSVTTLLSDLNSLSGVAVQSDGKILVSNQIDSYIKRMNPDGTNIETLGNGFENTRDVAIEADGKILVVSIDDIYRMNTDGSNIETLFNGYLEINSVCVQADGKIVFFDFYEGSVKRMNADGTGIETLNDYYELSSKQIAIQADGKIVVANFGFRSIMRFNSDGTNLETLGGVFDYPTGVAIQADGKIVVATQNSEIKRMNSDGTGLETIANVSNPGKLGIEADGKILVLDGGVIKRITEAYTSNRVVVSVIINEVPEAPTASTQVFCGSVTIADLEATGTNLSWYTSETSETVLESTSALATGSYYVSQSTNGCESERTEVSVTINDIPEAPTASAQVFCGSPTIADLEATGTNLSWYTSETSETVLESTSAVATGSYYVSQSTNGCESARTEVSITVNDIPEAPTALAQVFCGSATIADLEATGTNLSWYATETSETVLESTLAVATGSYYVSQSTNGCESARTEVSITVNDIPEAPTALAQVFCGSATIADLEATGTNLSWYATETSETVLESTSALATGSYYVSQSTNGCKSARTEVSITVYDIPEAPTAAAQVFCGSATVTNLLATGTNLSWYAGETSETVLEATTALATGSYFVSQSTNGCESARTEVSVTVNDIPEAPTAAAQVFCGSATITDLEATGTNLTWYAGETSETVLEATSVVATGSYYVSQSTNGCESERTLVNVVISEIPEVPTVTALITYSQGDDASALTATSGGLDLAWYETETGEISNSEAPTPSTETIGSTSYWVASVSDDGCYSERVEIVVTVEEVLGVGDRNILNAVKVYPNPTDSQVSIMLPSTNEVKITVYDLNGRLLLSKVNTSDNFIINLDQYEAGFYVLKIKMGQNETVKRIIKK